VIELGLLLEEIFGSRFAGFLFESQMHALVPAVLLRVAGFDALDANPESQRPRNRFGTHTNCRLKVS